MTLHATPAPVKGGDHDADSDQLEAHTPNCRSLANIRLSLTERHALSTPYEARDAIHHENGKDRGTYWENDSLEVASNDVYRSQQY